MQKIIFSLCLFLGIFTHLQAQTPLKNTEIMPVIGSWQGEVISYLDYTTRRYMTIPAAIDIEQIRIGVFTFTYQSQEDCDVFRIDTIAISTDGLFWGKEKIVSKQNLSDGSLQLVTEENSKDNDKAILVRNTYIFGQKSFRGKQEVQFEGETKWGQSIEYFFNTRAKLLTVKQMKADLAILKATWTNIHPALYRYNTKEQIEGYFKELEVKTNATMEQGKFFTLISQLNIKLNCGHSFVSYFNNKQILKNNLYSTVFFPVLFRVIDKKFIVTHNLTDNKTIQIGDEITAINSIATQTIIDSLLTVSKADGKNGLNKKLDNIALYPKSIYADTHALFDIFFPLFFKKDLNEPNFIVRVKSAKGVENDLEIAGLSKENRQAKFIAQYGDIPQNEKSWYIKPLDKQTVLFRIGDFMTYKWKFDFGKYLDSMFTGINQQGYKHLIVDVRQNEGGADDARDAVLSYLTPKNLGCANAIRRLYRFNAIPDSLQKYLDTWDDNFRKPKPDSLYVRTAEGFYESKFPNKCAEIMSKPNHFKGKIYLLTDVTNSSATFTMADVFKTNQLGTIVGETTGGTQQGINGGEIFFFNLPNSKIEMDLPLIYQAPKTARPDTGIQPDYEVKTTPKDIAENRDVQVEFVMKKLVGK